MSKIELGQDHFETTVDEAISGFINSVKADARFGGPWHGLTDDARADIAADLHKMLVPTADRMVRLLSKRLFDQDEDD